MHKFSLLLCMALAAISARAIDYSLIGPPGGSFKSVEYLRDGVLLAGSFDGHLYLSLNRGLIWKDVTPDTLTTGNVRGADHFSSGVGHRLHHCS